MLAETKLEKARLLLLSKKKATFFISLAYNLPLKLSEEIPTAAVDYKTIYFNPSFVDRLTIEEVLFVYLHEIMHVVLQHNTRKEQRIHTLWNAAGDYVINLFLVQAGFTMPAKGLLSYTYTGMTTEQVYTALIENDACVEPDYSDLIISEDSTELEEGEEAKEKIEVERIIANAVTAASVCKDMPGNLPEDLARIIKEIFSTQVSWQRILQKSLTSGTKKITSWLKPNRRYLPQYLPSTKTIGVNNITIAFDVSGSIYPDELNTYGGELYYLIKSVKPKKITLIAFDVIITKAVQVKNLNHLRKTLKESFNGGGGTFISPVMEYVQDNPTDILIVFTDGMFKPPSETHYVKKTQYIWTLTRESPYMEKLKGVKIPIDVKR